MNYFGQLCNLSRDTSEIKGASLTNAPLPTQSATVACLNLANKEHYGPLVVQIRGTHFNHNLFPRSIQL